MDHLDNPAGRLQRLFKTAKKLPQGEKAVVAWSGIFELTSPDDDALLLEKFGSMVALATETREQVERLTDDDPEVLLQHFPEVEATLKRCLQVAGQKLEWHLSGLSESGMHSLALCSSLLHRRTPEPTISIGEKKMLFERVESLRFDVSEAEDLDAEAKRSILDMLAEISRALLDANVRGTVPLRRAGDAMVGSLATDRALWQRVAGSKIAGGLWGLLVLVDTVLNVAVNAEEIGAPEPRPEIVQVWQSSTGHEPPKQLTQRSSVEHEPDDVIDAEIVEDGEDQTP